MLHWIGLWASLEAFSWFIILHITFRTGNQTRLEPGGGTWCRKTMRVTVYWPALHALLTLLFIAPRTASPEVVPTKCTGSWKWYEGLWGGNMNKIKLSSPISYYPWCWITVIRNTEYKILYKQVKFVNISHWICNKYTQDIMTA